jgi:hypothetical protein
MMNRTFGEYRPTEWQTMLEDARFVVETVETYIRHRPITALTQGASEENARKIYESRPGVHTGAARNLQSDRKGRTASS